MHIDKQHEIMHVHGRINQVRWLEGPPWNATKQHGPKYMHYTLTVPIGQVQALARQLEGEEYEETGVWTTIEPLFVHDPPHPAYAGFAAYLRTHPHAAHEFDSGMLVFGRQQIDDDDCQELCLLQVDKLLEGLRRARRSSAFQEVQTIRAQIVQCRGEAYGLYKARLQELLALAYEPRRHQ